MNKTSCHPRRPEVSPWRRPNKRANCPPLSDPVPMARFDRGHVQLPVAADHRRSLRRVRSLSAAPARPPARFWPTASYPLDPADPRTPVAGETWHVTHCVLKDHRRILRATLLCAILASLDTMCFDVDRYVKRHIGSIVTDDDELMILKEGRKTQNSFCKC